MKKYFTGYGLFLYALFFFLGVSLRVEAWGFYAHREINKMAVFTLPGELILFYKQNLPHLIEGSVRPDQRRFILKEEACRHFIDLEYYSSGDSCLVVGLRENEVLELFHADSLQKHGRLPWHLAFMKAALTKAFKEGDRGAVLRLSADAGHYLADACVPLHTTCNYNGQLTGQQGIHALWESRLPELFALRYSYWVGAAHYLQDFTHELWEVITVSHEAKDSVLHTEAILSARFPLSRKYSWEMRGRQLVKVVSPEFAEAYHELLHGMVERQMKRAILLVGSFWYTCWMDAGEPQLENLRDKGPTQVDSVGLEFHDERNCIH